MKFFSDEAKEDSQLFHEKQKMSWMEQAACFIKEMATSQPFC